MRKLSIKLFNKDNVIQEQLICGKLDATSHITVLSEVYFIKKTNTPLDGKNLHIPVNIVSWNIFEGLVTIYYENGMFMEVGRINEPDNG